MSYSVHAFSSANLKVQIRMLYVNFAMVQYPIDEAQRLMYVPCIFSVITPN
jgi:hypothetical protein